MLLVERLGYVAIGAPDVEAAVDFFVNVCQLEVSERRDDVVFIRGGEDHHWLRIEQREEPGIIRLGFQVRDAEAAEEIRGRLAERDIEVRPGGTLKDDRVVDAFRFTEVNGLEVELFGEMVQMPLRPQPTGVGISMLLHAVFLVSDVESTMAYWVDVLDFRRSDQIEDRAAFLRCGNGYHHSIAFLKVEERAGALDHVCFLVDDIDDVMLMVNAGRNSALRQEPELVRHAASGSIGTYLEYEPLQLGIEYCVGHGQVPDEYPGRLLLASPETVNLWNATPRRALAQSEAAAPAQGARGISVD